MTDPIKTYYDFIRTNTPPVTKLLSLVEFQQTPYVLAAREVLEELFEYWEQISSLRVTYWLVKSWLTAINGGQLWFVLERVLHRGGELDKYMTFWLGESIFFQATINERDTDNCIVWVGKECEKFQYWMNREILPTYPNHWQICYTQFTFPKEVIDSIFSKYDLIKEEFLKVHKDGPELKFPMFDRNSNEGTTIANGRNSSDRLTTYGSVSRGQIRGNG